MHPPKIRLLFTYDIVRYVPKHPLSLRDDVAPKSVTACSVRAAIVAFALWGEYEQERPIVSTKQACVDLIATDVRHLHFKIYAIIVIVIIVLK